MEKYLITKGNGVYFITFTVVDWLPVFIRDTPCQLIVDSLNFCITGKNLRVFAYVIMPNHLHAILFDADFNAERLKQTLNDFRKFTGRQLADYCTQQYPPFYTEVLRKYAGKDRQRRFWQPTQHPVGIFTPDFLQPKVDYIHCNPCRLGLVRQPEHWRFSSATFWLTHNATDTDVNLSDIGR